MSKKVYFLLVVTLCLNTCLSIKASSKLYETALKKTARRGDTKQLAVVLQNDVNVDATDTNGWTALHHACKNEKVDNAHLLLISGAHADGVDSQVPTPLSLSLDNRNEELTALLLSYGADPNSNLPLHALVQHGRADLVKLLATYGAQLDKTDARGKTLLHSAVEASDSATASLLLDNKANVLAKDAKGKTAFDYAYTKRNKHIMKLLIRKGGFPLDNIKTIDPALYEAIKQYGVTVIDDWFGSANNQNAAMTLKEDQFGWISLSVWGVFLVGCVAYLSDLYNKKRVHQPAPAHPQGNAARMQDTLRMLTVTIVLNKLEDYKNQLAQTALELINPLYEAVISNAPVSALHTIYIHSTTCFALSFDKQKASLEKILSDASFNDSQKSLIMATLTQTYYGLLKLFMTQIEQYALAQPNDELLESSTAA